MDSKQKGAPNNGNVEKVPNSTMAKKMVLKKLPVIKQTKTSIFRIAKANPLLLLENNDEDRRQADDLGIRNIKLPKSIQPYSNYIIQSDSFASTKQQLSDTVGLTRTASVRGVKPQKPTTANNLHRSNSVRVQSTTKCVPKTLPKHVSRKAEQIIKKEATKDKKPTTVRRSLSAAHYDKKKGQPERSLMKKSEMARSLNDVRKAPSTVMVPDVSPIIEKNRTVCFKTPNTPLGNQRRRRTGNYHVATPFQRRQSTPLENHSELGTQALWGRLQNWLNTNKKSTRNFHHLKCFGLDGMDSFKNEIDENKENIEREITQVTSSYEDLNISDKQEESVESKDESGEEIDIRRVAQNALQDLHFLILEGFPHEQCQAWLQMIKQKYDELLEDPLYWECRAAIEQGHGNITTAVECYQKAIIHGAQVNTVEHSLEHLLQQFSLLNISMSDSTDEKTKKDRARIVLDARNVFKSSIIQFAVRERTIKKNVDKSKVVEKQMIATPVRRSTRNKNSCTPGVKLCSSLRDLDDSVRNNVNFKSNKALTFN